MRLNYMVWLNPDRIDLKNKPERQLFETLDKALEYCSENILFMVRIVNVAPGELHLNTANNREQYGKIKTVYDGRIDGIDGMFCPYCEDGLRVCQACWNQKDWCQACNGKGHYDCNSCDGTGFNPPVACECCDDECRVVDDFVLIDDGEDSYLSFCSVNCFNEYERSKLK